MFRAPFRIALRQTQSLLRTNTRSSPRRFLSTTPTPRRTWKGAVVRWGLAGAAVYYYNTSALFAEEPESAIAKLDGSMHRLQETSLPTVEAVVAEKRRREEDVRRQARQEEEARRLRSEAVIEDEAVAQKSELQEDTIPSDNTDVGDLEAEADQQGAFNPETGEINWDCPCLGGMAHGPCGEEFRAAFSCFVYSKEEPKGMECIDKFKGMQDCFRLHPEMYGSELEDDEDEVEEELSARDREALASAVPGSESKVTEVASEKASGKEDGDGEVQIGARDREALNSAIPGVSSKVNEVGPEKALGTESKSR